ncbi:MULTISPECIES: response regulator [unclassified Caulobacter]|jgi:CheY-like chemotaxis protein|uniref:response regulator n=1 Tax=unclassified Caulobacter TaxID=2648921 RepID=UPI0006FC8AF2|nr:MULTISPECIES: response regulator [unclassified Caulobacter]KQV62499.1 response regulator [Caulobacter sp. Root342]KQV65491.1 response regulator [Caulobacter sp. Root343]
MTGRALDVLIVEDEMLLAIELEHLIEEVGCHSLGCAMSSDEAVDLAEKLHPDLALVDVHLSDGPTGVEVARKISRDCGGVALFMTANVKRLPDDFAGACGVIGKPYSEHGVKTALSYLRYCLQQGQAPGPVPVGLTLAPAYAELWGLSDVLPKIA